MKRERSVRLSVGNESFASLATVRLIAERKQNGELVVKSKTESKSPARGSGFKAGLSGVPVTSGGKTKKIQVGTGGSRSVTFSDPGSDVSIRVKDRWEEVYPNGQPFLSFSRSGDNIRFSTPDVPTPDPNPAIPPEQAAREEILDFSGGINSATLQVKITNRSMNKKLRGKLVVGGERAARFALPPSGSKTFDSKVTKKVSTAKRVQICAGARDLSYSDP